MSKKKTICIVKNSSFEIRVFEGTEKNVPKQLEGKEYLFDCQVIPLQSKVTLNDENFKLMKKALLKILENVKNEITFKKRLTYFGELNVSFKNLKKKWIRSSVFNIQNKHYKNIVYSTLNKLGKTHKI